MPSPPPDPSSPAASPPEPAAPNVATLLKRLGPAGPLAIAAVALPPISGMALIYFMAPVADWLRSHQESGLVLYAIAFALLSGLALLPTYAQAALGGFAYGMALGLPAALLGFAGGAAIGYFIARRASGDRVVRLLHENPKWEAVRDALVADHTRRSFWKTTGMVALLRMPPNSPFALTNLVMASVKVPWTSFILGTVLGMAPRTAAAVWIGATVGMTSRGEFSTPLWLQIAGVVLSVLVLVVITDIADRAIRNASSPADRIRMRTTLPPKIAGGALIAAIIVAFLVFKARRAQDTPSAPDRTSPAARLAAPPGNARPS